MPGLTGVEREPNSLVLCFDGTGNTFSGSNGDTNVAKILHKMDRNHPKQYHYYQTGIGTYVINERSVNQGVIGTQLAKISKTLDSGLATSFDAHVIAGYRFLMRYYEPGDKIYMFGFSRGAFTAKFLTHMIWKVGLLCKGNEEMVPFAYLLYQRWLQSASVDDKDLHQQGPCHSKNGTPPNGDADAELSEHELLSFEVDAFKETFCKKTPGDDEHPGGHEIKVFFLGMWDCVSSVAVLEPSSPVPLPVSGAAKYVRHAVAIDERRVKFKPALLVQDTNKHDVKSNDASMEDCMHDSVIEAEREDPPVAVKEVWFPGNHGDIGGGWPIAMSEAKAAVRRIEEPEEAERERKSWWNWIKGFSLSKVLFSKRAKKPSLNPKNDAYQLSDISLDWMIQEIDSINPRHLSGRVRWGPNRKLFQQKFREPGKNSQALSGPIHDTLKVGRGSAFAKVMFWKFLEIWPFQTRWELDTKQEWVRTRFPLNRGSCRDIPETAVLHNSVLWRLKHDPQYQPGNNHGGDSDACLDKTDSLRYLPVEDERALQGDEQHKLYEFKKREVNTTGDNRKSFWWFW